MEDDNVLFIRQTEKNTNFTAEDDVWDDTALIKAYDKAINLAKDEVTKRMGMEVENNRENLDSHRKKSQTKTSRKWSVGSPCRALYSRDGEEYEAIIKKIFENSGTCLVSFIGYGNVQKVHLSELRESNGLRSQMEQQRNSQESANGVESSIPTAQFSSVNTAKYNGATGEHMDCENEIPKLSKNVFNPGSSFNSVYGMMPPAPPLPPQLMSNLPDNDADALSSMLMSWYISGFHTGYYHGIKQARHMDEKRKK